MYILQIWEWVEETFIVYHVMFFVFIYFLLSNVLIFLFFY